MNKNRIYYISITTAVGLCSFTAGFLFGKFSVKKPEETEITENESEKIPEDENSEKSPVVEEAIEAIDYDERVKDLEYRSQSDDSEDALNEEEKEELENARINEAVKANAGKIAIMEKKEFERRHIMGFNDVDHDYREIFYFTDEDYITDEFGGILTPMEKYVGNELDKFDFKTNDQTTIYIENYPMEMDYVVTKVKDISRDVYFDDTVNYN